MAAPNEGKPKVPYSPDELLDKNGMLVNNDQDGRYFPIAIVGIGCRVPQAENPTEFEKVLIEERCAIVPVPKDRWNHEDFYDSTPQSQGHYVIPKMGFCEKYFHFDPEYFNLSPKEVCFMDPQHRQTLEITDEALQDAGYTPETIPKETGVYVGMGIIDFPGALAENRKYYNGHTMTGFSHSCAANRVSHHYGFTGPSCAVDTACAASLTALHVGCMSLWNKENKVALCGATSHLYSPETTIAFSHLGVLSATGNSAPFDHSNNGYVRAEGTSMVVMKPLDDAIRDGDHVYCVIRASTSAHNGNSNSLTLPSADGQEELIRRCYDQAGIPMSKVSFVEAHGTGTPVGDPLETKALGRTFGRSRNEPMPIASAKSNFGHLEVAAGMIQVVKAALMLEKRTFYKQIKWTAPNYRIDFEELNLRMQLKHEPYTRKEKFVIGVNTFGFGGSLVHMIFEEFRPLIKSLPNSTTAGWSFGSSTIKGRKIAIPLSAKVQISLINTARKWLEWSNEGDAQTVVSWLATRREHHSEERMVILADSGADFRAKLQLFINGVEHEDIILGSKPANNEKPAVCMVYPGWGQQWLDMGRSLFKQAPEFRLAVEKCDKVFKNISGYSALEKYNLFKDLPQGDVIEKSNMDGSACKPGILFMQVGLTHLLRSWGILPDSVMGMGLGEQVAAYAAGAMSLDQIISLMYLRMQTPPKETFLDTLKQTINGPKPKSAKFFSTITGEQYDGSLNADYWWQNVSSEKKESAAVDAVIRCNPGTIFIEVSAASTMKPVLESRIKELDARCLVVSCGEKNQDDWITSQRMMSELHVSGYPVDWKNITHDCAVYAPIPLYGWNDRVYTINSVEYDSRRFGLIRQTYKDRKGRINTDHFNHLTHYQLNDEYVFPAAAYIEYFAEYDQSKYATLKDIQIKNGTKIPPLTKEGYIQYEQIDVKRNMLHLSAVGEDKIQQAEATLTKARNLDQPPKIDVNNIQERCKEITTRDEIYRKYTDLGMSYGNFYQLIDTLHIGESEALALCKGSHSRLRFERLQTVIIDTAFQTAISAFTRGNSLYLPKEVGHLEMFIEKIPTGTPFRVYTTLKEWNLKTILCDIIITDDNGNTWVLIENFKADSTAEFTTDVDLTRCCYVTKWQSADAQMPEPISLHNIEDPVDSTVATKIQLLKPAVGALSEVVRQKMNSTPKDVIIDNLHHLTSCPNNKGISNPETVHEKLQVCPSISEELNHINDIAACIPKQMGNPETIPASLSYLQNSEIVKASLSSAVHRIKEAIKEALKKKKVIRVCELGEGSGCLTRQLVEALEYEILNHNVDYTFTASTEDSFNSINEYLSDLPSIKFKVLDEDSMSSLSGSYDLVLSLDICGKATGIITQAYELLSTGGLFFLIENTNALFLSRFIFINASHPEKKAPVQWKESLSQANFDLVQSIPEADAAMFTTIVGMKERKGSETDMQSARIMPYDITPSLKENDTWRMTIATSNDDRVPKYSITPRRVLQLDELRIKIRTIAINEKNENTAVAYSGIVESRGDNVSKFNTGDAVVGLSNLPITSHVTCTEKELHIKPHHISWSEAAHSILNYTTAYSALIEKANLKPGETVLIHSSRSQVGQAAATLALMKGSKVIVSLDNDTPNPAQNLGVVAFANPYAANFKQDVMTLTGGRGIDVILQATTDDLPHTVTDVMAYGLRICKVGVQKNLISATANAKYSTFHLSSYMKRSQKKIQNVLAHITDLLYTGRLPALRGDASHISNAAADLNECQSSNETKLIDIPDDFMPSSIQGTDIRVQPDGQYIVTGAATPLGLEAARWLSDNGARYVTMISTTDGTDNFTKATQRYMESNGTKVYNVKADMTSDSDVERVISECSGKQPPLKGIFILTGYTSADQTDCLVNIMEAQLQSSRLLHKATESLNLDHFVVFSPIGDNLDQAPLPGNGDLYTQISSVCETRSTLGQRALLFQHGQMRGVDVLSEMAQTYEDAGCESLHIHEYLSILSCLLQRDDLPTAVSITKQNWTKTQSCCQKNLIRFQHLVTENGLSKGSTGGDAQAEATKKCCDFVAGLTGADSELIGPSQPMTLYGVDSLMSQDIISWAQKTFKVTLEQTDIFGGLTINQLLSKA